MGNSYRCWLCALPAGEGDYKPSSDRLLDSLRSEFPNILPRVHLVSSKTGHGIADLADHIRQIALAQPGVLMRVPEGYNDLKAALQQRSAGIAKGKAPLAPLPEAFAECHSALGSDDAEAAAQALQLFHSWGYALWFQDVPGLSESIILRPQWLGDVMSAVISASEQAQKALSGGRVGLSAVLRQLERGGAPPEVAGSLLLLMERFNILMRVDDDTCIVPAFLPESPARAWPEMTEESSALAPPPPPGAVRQTAVVTLSFFPDTLLVRLQCRLLANQSLTALESWRTGMVLSRSSQRARARRAGNSLSIVAVGSQPQALAATIVNTLMCLVKESYPGVAIVDQLFSCPACLADDSVVAVHVFSSTRLQAQQHAGKHEAECPGCRKRLPVRQLLLQGSNLCPEVILATGSGSSGAAAAAAVVVKEGALAEAQQAAMFEAMQAALAAYQDQMVAKVAAAVAAQVSAFACVPHVVDALSVRGRRPLTSQSLNG